MKFSILEEAVLCAALERYLPFCEGCLQNPENEHQLAHIRGEIETINGLLEKIRADYVSQGGDPEWL